MTKKTITASETFTQYLRECNMRVTSERLSIIEVMSKHTGLFTIEDLHSQMSREAFPVSTATLYNTINLLIDAGMVKSLRLAEHQTTYYQLDTANTHHIYLVCQQCGAIKESNTKTLTRYINKYNFTGFAPETFMLTVYGLCRKCRKEKGNDRHPTMRINQ